MNESNRNRLRKIVTSCEVSIRMAGRHAYLYPAEPPIDVEPERVMRSLCQRMLMALETGDSVRFNRLHDRLLSQTEQVAIENSPSWLTWPTSRE